MLVLQELERAMSAQRQASLDMAGLAEQLAKAKDDSDDEESEVAAVEMVLEAYFMHIDNTYNKLQTLTEYIDDTEVTPAAFRVRRVRQRLP